MKWTALLVIVMLSFNPHPLRRGDATTKAAAEADLLWQVSIPIPSEEGMQPEPLSYSRLFW